MRVRVTRVPRPNRQEDVELPEGATVAMALAKVGAPLDAVVVIRAGTPIPTDARVSDGDDLKVVNVFSGG